MLRHLGHISNFLRTPIGRLRISGKEVFVMRKLIAVTLIFLQASCASVTVWDDFSSYISNAWDDLSGYVMSWFNDDKKPEIAGDNLPGNIAGNWDKLSGTLNDALTLRDKQETLPDSTWMPFTEDKASNGKKIFLFMFVFISLFTANFTQINEIGGVYALFFIFFRLKFGFKNIF